MLIKRNQKGIANLKSNKKTNAVPREERKKTPRPHPRCLAVHLVHHYHHLQPSPPLSLRNHLEAVRAWGYGDTSTDRNIPLHRPPERYLNPSLLCSAAPSHRHSLFPESIPSGISLCTLLFKSTAGTDSQGG